MIKKYRFKKIPFQKITTRSKMINWNYLWFRIKIRLHIKIWQEISTGIKELSYIECRPFIGRKYETKYPMCERKIKCEMAKRMEYQSVISYTVCKVPSIHSVYHVMMLRASRSKKSSTLNTVSALILRTDFEFVTETYSNAHKASVQIILSMLCERHQRRMFR